jgi:polar amino acid transport system substrate-binding protein
MKVSFSRFAMLSGISMVLMAAPAFADLKIGVAAEPYAPFTSKDASGVWVGWEVDVMTALCAEIGEKCVIEEVAWDGIIPALTANKFDAIMSSMSITDKRKEVINFTSAYYKSAGLVVGAKSGDLDIAPEHLAGKTIGTQVSTIHSAYVDKYYVTKGATNKTYATQDEANNDLAAGRLDYVMADGIALTNFLESEQGVGCCEAKGPVPDDEVILGLGAGMGLRKEDTALLDKLNIGLAALGQKNAFAAINAKWKLEGKLLTPPNIKH